MSTSTAVDVLIFFSEAKPFNSGVLGQSVSSAEVIDLRGVPRAHLEIGRNGRKRLKYEQESLWLFPPSDLGRVQSHKLDDLLYGERF